jgi:hypothetical protein
MRKNIFGSKTWYTSGLDVHQTEKRQLSPPNLEFGFKQLKLVKENRVQIWFLIACKFDSATHFLVTFLTEKDQVSYFCGIYKVSFDVVFCWQKDFVGLSVT